MPTSLKQKQKQAAVSLEPSFDYTVYELERFCEGLLRSDLTLVINCLFRSSDRLTPTLGDDKFEIHGGIDDSERYLLVEDPLWAELRAMRGDFFVSSLFHQLMGYLKQIVRSSTQSKSKQQPQQQKGKQQQQQQPQRRQQQRGESRRDNELLLAILEAAVFGVTKMIQRQEELNSESIETKDIDSSTPPLSDFLRAIQLAVDILLEAGNKEGDEEKNDESEARLLTQLKAIEEGYASVSAVAERFLPAKPEEQRLERWFLRARFASYNATS